MGKCFITRRGGGLVIKELNIQTLTFIPTKYYTDSLGNNLVAFNIFQLPTGITWKDVLVMEVRQGYGIYFAKLNSGTSARLLIQGSDFNIYSIADSETQLAVGGNMAYSKTDFTGRIIVPA